MTGVSAERTAYVGDDLPDLPIMTRVGVSIAVSDACQIVRQNAAMVTLSKGGSGAVREICETILKAQGLWEQALKRFFSRQDDRPGASNGQRAIAAEKGKTRRRFLFE